MKLPGINYKYGVQSLGRESMAPAIRAQQAQAEIIHNAIQVPASVAIHHLEEYERQQIEIGIETAALGMAEAETQFTKSYGDKEYFSADEIPEEIPGIRRTKTRILPGGEEVEEVRNNIPAYEVRAELYRRHMRKSLNAQAEHVPQGRARDQWMADMKVDLEKNYGRFIASGIVEQDKVIQTQREARFKVLMQGQKFDLAREIVNNMKITAEEKGVYHAEIDKTLETSRYEMSHANLDVTAMNGQIDKLLDPDYRAKGGHLTDDERDNYVTFLRRGIATATAGNENAEAVAKSMFSARLSRIQQAISGGEDVPIATINNIVSEAPKYPGKAGQVNNLIIDYESATDYRGMIASGGSFSQIEAAIDAFDSDSDYIDDVIKTDSLRQQHEKSMALYNKNSIGWAERYRGAEVDPLMPGEDPKYLAQAGQKRLAQYYALRATYGEGSGIFKPSERNAWIDKINNNSATDNMSLALQMRSMFGDDVGKVVEELTSNGAAKNFLVASDAIARNNVMGAQFVLRGAELNAADASYTQGYATDLQHAISDQIGIANAANTDMYSANLQALENVYVYLAKAEGVRPGVFKKSLVEDAYRIVLGEKHHEYKGYSLELPPNMSGEEFEKWMFNTNGDMYFQEMGWKAGNGWTPKLIQTGLFDGTLQLLATGPNEYFIMNPKTGLALFDYSKGKNEAKPLRYTIDRGRMPTTTNAPTGPFGALSDLIERKRMGRQF